jgi:hypothetical protein
MIYRDEINQIKMSFFKSRSTQRPCKPVHTRVRMPTAKIQTFLCNTILQPMSSSPPVS